MPPTTAVLVDDCPDQLRLLARVLQRAGWQVYTAAGSIEGEALTARILAGPDAAHTVILTDLALRLRARMHGTVSSFCCWSFRSTSEETNNRWEVPRCRVS